MLIRAYGVFWYRAEVDWSPGKGNQRRMLGRHKQNRQALRVTDFWDQRGIYILYGNHGVYYAGITKERALGKRLQDHNFDKHAENWDKFSWFGFREVLKDTLPDGTRRLKDVAAMKMVEPSAMIDELEAILIQALAVANRNERKFAAAEKWEQIRRDEILKYLH